MKTTNHTIKKTFYYVKYLRKSSEEVDGRSIRNQEEVLDNVVEEIITKDVYNEYVNMGTYKDENYSGTDSERPSFKEVLKLIGQGKINMILVTDLSRLSRSIAESIHYIQSVFVMLDIRFVAFQLPTLDTYINPEKIYSLEVPIQSMMNENHCAETSIKVRRTFDRLRADGKFIGAFAGFGWVKSPKDKHILLLDEEANEIMHLMKRLLFQYYSCNQIAKKLNEKGIPSPAGYKKLKGINHNSISKNINGDYLWSAGSVRKMLSRPENVGDLIQGRVKVKSYKIHIKMKIPESDWFVTEGGCPAIFTKEEQNKINKLLTMNFRELKRQADKSSMDVSLANEQVKDDNHAIPHLFSGFVRCPDCNRSMNRKGTKKGYGYYICSTYKNYSACSKHSIREDVLAKIVYAAIKQQIDVTVEMEKLIQSISDAPIEKNKNFDYQTQKKKQETELCRVMNYKKNLYQDYKDDLITKYEYIEMKKSYEERYEKIKATIRNIENESINMHESINQENVYFDCFAKHKGFYALNRDLLADLIDVIYVYDNKNVKIKFAFMDPYKSHI